MLMRATWQHDLEFTIDYPTGESLVTSSIPRKDRPGPGPSPVELVQAAVAGCTGIDVVLILQKMRKTITAFSVETDPTRRDEEPRIYTRIEILYHLEGPDLDAASVRRAVQLSEEKYCSVSAMLSPTVEITSRIELNGEWIETG